MKNDPREKPISWERRGDCFICTSHVGGRYPSTTRNGTTLSIARRILTKRHRDITALMARHTCDNTKCIRPDHIVIGTAQDNVDDKRSRGRERHPNGEQLPQSKLTRVDVVEIKRLRGNATQIELAKIYGVSQTLISAIQRRKVWKHI